MSERGRSSEVGSSAFFADSVKYTAAYGAGGINFVQSTGNTTPAVTTTADEIGRASWRERAKISGVAGTLKKKKEAARKGCVPQGEITAGRNRGNTSG